MSDKLQDDNLPTTGVAGAVILLAKAISKIKATVGGAVQSVTTTDKHLEVEREGNNITVSLIDVAGKADTERRLEALENQDTSYGEDIGKLKTFTGYEEDLDLPAKVQTILGE